MIKNFNNLILIEGGASRKKIYRLKCNKFNLIVLDFSDDVNEFDKHLNVYNILKDINISIPEIFEVYYDNHIIVTEDFGDQRFDKTINRNNIYNLLKDAISSLIIINNSILNVFSKGLSKYNYNIFKSEVNEFIEYYFPYKKIDNSLREDFLQTWKIQYENLKIDFNAFVHKDFELTNLMFLPSKDKHLKCGILDFQSAFVGFSGWDVFSLLENSRVYFTRANNEKLIKYFYKNTNQKIDFSLFRQQYYFFNTSRQTRLLGRWIKFLKVNKNKNYLKYINVTTRRLNESLLNLNNKQLNKIYNKIFNEINA